ncbi:putative nitrate reductase [Methylotuvimicrobium alcaliphilum 20Z]|uniref:Nitrate reductase n=2 Tax=Methylotuvimicrobium alcaliphilum TaxID=271065 RepID=G4SU62_META2|nr:putative nitrate reductase [Methylotuvimicrobium alcaliphilum 20Z]
MTAAMNEKTIKTTCPYCGVGCGIVATVDDAIGHQVTIQGDPDHPSNFGKLCSKGSALGDTVSTENRLLHPEVHCIPCDWNTALDTVADGLTSVIRQYGPDAIAFYVSGQLLTEDYYVVNKFMKGFIGSANIDTNSRLCMSSAVTGYKRAFGADAVPCSYEDLEAAELIVLTGSNTAWCHPIVFQRIRKAKENNPALKIVVIDPRRTATCDSADLHLTIKPGMDGLLFNGLLTYLAQTDALDNDYIAAHTQDFEWALQSARNTAGNIEIVAQDCGLSSADVEKFYGWYAKTAKTVTVYSQGVNQSSSGSDKCNAIINCHLATGRIGKPGMGPFSFTGQPNAMGGREVGGLANTLAAHMELDNPEHIDRVARFWQTDRIATRPGLKAVELFDAIDAGTIKAVWIIATNPVVTLPDADKVKNALKRCNLVIVSDCIKNTDTVDLAHIRLPAAGWSEKAGTVTNMERRISRQRPLFPFSGLAKPDWWIISQVAARMGFKHAFDYRSSADIFREHAALSGFENNLEGQPRDFDISAFADLTEDAYDRLQPVQWPVTKKNPNGTERLFTDGKFYTASRKARFIAIRPRAPVNKPDPNYPFTLNTGRLRDQWHTMTRTGLSAKLNAHKPEPFVEIHPLDAARYHLQTHDLATISSLWGNMIARVVITENQQPGSLFVPMHWTAQFSSRGRVGALVNPVIDPHSGQPESKQTPAAITPYRALWYAMLLTRSPLMLDDIEYRVTVKGNDFIRYELADRTPFPSWRDWLKSLSGESNNPHCLEYSDPERGVYRSALIIDGRLEVCLFVSSTPPLPETGWLETLFAQPQINKEERLRLLSALPPEGQEDCGRLVCSCFNVGEKSIAKAIREFNLANVEQIGQQLSAGKGCGSCLPELKRFLPRQ